MPRLNGEGTLTALAARPSGKRTPVPVIVSAYDSEIMHSKADELGARHFLPKPVLPESLRDLVRWLAGKDAAYAPSARPAAPIDDLADLQVLVVEDNAINQQLAVELLESRRVKVDVANNGQEAIERIHAHPPTHYSVVLMDLQMPVMDGYEATRLLRMDSRYVNLPIVAMTAHAMADERARCQVLGMNGHISKPIDPEVLYAALAGFHHAGAAPRPGPTTSPAARAAPAAGTDEPSLPEIAGLDVHAGLHHAGGKAAFYSQLLRRFAHDYADFTEPFESVLAAGHWEDATRQAHTLKGLAASLGADEVRSRAAALENAARVHDVAAVRSNLAGTGACLAPLVAALRAHFAIEDARAPALRRDPRDRCSGGRRHPRSPNPPIGLPGCASCCRKETSRRRRFGKRDSRRSPPAFPLTSCSASRSRSTTSISTPRWSFWPTRQRISGRHQIPERKHDVAAHRRRMSRCCRRGAGTRSDIVECPPLFPSDSVRATMMPEG